MVQILVPTDLTRDARSGIRFAIEWSRQQKVKLIFAYVQYIPRLAKWNDEEYRKYATLVREKDQRDLEKMVVDIYRKKGIVSDRYECRIIEGIITEATILDYCRLHPEISLICMSTHGATGMQKLFGTHAGNVMTQAAIPVVVVPKDYRTKPIKSILYACDLEDYDDQLKIVAGLASGFGASLQLLHIAGIGERTPNKAVFEKVLSEQCGYPVNVQFSKEDEPASLAINLRRQIRLLKPSLAVLFTRRRRNILQRLFFPGTAEHLSFSATVPLLVYPKEAHATTVIKEDATSKKKQIDATRT